MMANSKIFQDDYQYFLNEINYKRIETDSTIGKVETCFRDELSFDTSEDKSLRIELKRIIKFTPDALYELTVSFGAVLKIQDGVTEMEKIDWNKECKEDPVCSRVLQGLLSRISMQIAQITSSYGQPPMVTPPNLLN